MLQIDCDEKAMEIGQLYQAFFITHVGCDAFLST